MLQTSFDVNCVGFSCTS